MTTVICLPQHFVLGIPEIMCMRSLGISTRPENEKKKLKIIVITNKNILSVLTTIYYKSSSILRTRNRMEDLGDSCCIRHLKY